MMHATKVHATICSLACLLAAASLAIIRTELLSSVIYDVYAAFEHPHCQQTSILAVSHIPKPRQAPTNFLRFTGVNLPCERKFNDLAFE